MIKPDYSEAITNYGFVLQTLRNYSSATVQFEKALKLKSKSEEALVNLSKAYFDDGRVSKSIEVIKKGLLFKPNNIQLLKNMIEPLLLLNRLDEAEEACSKILSIHEQDTDAINAKGTIFRKRGHYEEAKTNFLKALEINKDLFLPKINIAAIYQLEGHTEEAVKIYSELPIEAEQNPQFCIKKVRLHWLQETLERVGEITNIGGKFFL